MLYSECFMEDLDRFESSENFVAQQKIDGDNFKMIVDSGSITLINRHENDYTRQFPEIVKNVKLNCNCVLNGELAYWNEEKQIYDFNLFRGRQGLQNNKKIEVRSRLYPVKFYVFDIIEYEGVNMVDNPEYPFKVRMELLQTLISNDNFIQLVPIRKDLKQFFKEECEKNREGIVVKSLSNIYSNCRTKTIMKCKNWNLTHIQFEKFEDNKAGITCENKQGDRVLVAGKNAELVRAMIIQNGYVNLKVRHLQDRTENNRLREPTYKGVV